MVTYTPICTFKIMSYLKALVSVLPLFSLSRIGGCQEVQCPDLDYLPNGSVENDDNSVGSIATYKCFDLYETIPPKQVTCLPSGDWSDSGPICPPHQPYFIVSKSGSTWVEIALLSGLWSTVDGGIVKFKYTIKECSITKDFQVNLTDFSTRKGDIITMERNDHRSYRASVLRNFTVKENSNYTLSFINTYKGKVSVPIMRNWTSKEGKPTGEPQDLKYRVTPNTIFLFWNPINCTDRNTIIERYNIVFAPDLDGDFLEDELLRSTTFDVPEVTTTYTLNGLIPQTAYTIKINGANRTLEGPAARIVATTVSPQTFQFLLKGVYYSNNSIVDLSTIEENSNSLFCLVPLLNCCKNSGSLILPSEDGGLIVHRGPGKIFLSRKRDSVSLSLGLVTCEIQDIDKTQHLFVLNSAEMLIPPVITNFFVDPIELALVCLSKGPIFKVEWIENSVKIKNDSPKFGQFQRILSRTTLKYEQKLKGRANTDFLGNYTCRIIDSMMRSVERSIQLDYPCKAPPRLENGVVEYNGTFSGSVADYKCNEGYKLTGDSTRTCQNSKWTKANSDCTLLSRNEGTVTNAGTARNAGTKSSSNLFLLQIFGVYTFRYIFFTFLRFVHT